MRFFRWCVLGIISFLVAVIAPSQLFRQALSLSLCTIFSFQTACPVGSLNGLTPVVAQSPPSQDLSGTWIRRGTTFTGTERGCRVGYSGQLSYENRNLEEGVEFALTQEGERLQFEDETVFYRSDDGSGSYVMSAVGRRTGDTVRVTYTGGGFTTEFTGQISPDGQTITGEVRCEYADGSATATGTLTWTQAQATAQGSNGSEVNDRPSFEQAFQQADVDEAVRLFEEFQTQQYQAHLGLNAAKIAPSLSATEISHRLYDLSQATGTTTAFLQAVSLADRTDLILVRPTPSAGGGTKEAKADKVAQKNRDRSEVATRNIVLEAQQESLQGIARQFTNQIVNPARRRSNQYRETGKQLYDWLVAPLELDLADSGVQTLIISADTGLRSLPMAALWDGKQYLIEKYSLALIPSFRLTETAVNDLSNARLLAMGISKSTQGQTPLPAVGAEVETLSEQLWDNAQGVLNENATIAAFKTRLSEQQPEIVHLATHADFQAGSIDQSYIQFWNEKLSLGQLSTLANEPGWEQVKMLVLSACQTALGDEEAELGFTGLAVQSGVDTGIGTLWSVSDVASLGLMSEFYSRLQSAPHKAEALRQAQLSMLNGDIQVLQAGQLQLSNRGRFSLPEELMTQTTMDLSHPYFWAGVTVIGDWS